MEVKVEVRWRHNGGHVVVAVIVQQLCEETTTVLPLVLELSNALSSHLRSIFLGLNTYYGLR